MAEGKITQFWGLDELAANKAAAIALIKEGVAEVEAAKKAILANNTVSGSSENSSRAAAGLKDMSSGLKTYADAAKQTEILQAKLNFATSDAAKEQAKLSVQLSETNRKIRDAAQASNLDWQARQKSIQAIKDQAAADKQAAVAFKANKASEAAAQKALDDRKQAAIKKVAELYDKESQLRLRLKDVTAEYNRSFIVLGENAEATVKLRDRVNALKGTLNTMNQAVGNYSGNVGRYTSHWNGLGNAINQVGREIPNFAQSAQLGFLAISNNLPILADEIKNTKIRIAQLKAEGKEAPSLFSQIAKSVFSWQTVMVLIIAVLVKYGAQMLEVISGTSDAEKAQRAYNKALTEALKAESEHIGVLIQAKAALIDTNISRERQIELFNKAKSIAPEYLSFIDAETASIEFLNAALAVQISRRIDLAREAAVQKTIADATTELVNAQQNVNKEYGIWATITSSFSTTSKDAINLSKGAKELAASLQTQNEKLGRGSALTGEQADKVLKLSHAETILENAMRGATSASEQERNVLLEKIQTTEKEVALIRGEYGDAQNIAYKRKKKEVDKLIEENAQRRIRLGLIDQEIKKQAEEQQKNERKLKNGQDDIELINIKLKVLAAKDGSKEEIAAKTEQYKKEGEIEKKRLAETYKNAQKNSEYLKRAQLIDAETADKIEKLKVKKGPKEKPTDLSEFNAQERLIKAKADLEKELYEITVEYNNGIVENEKNTAVERVKASGIVLEAKRAQIYREAAETLSLLENEEKAIAKIETRGAKNNSERQKVSVSNKQAIAVEKQIALEKALSEEQKIENENATAVTRIYVQEINKQITKIRERLDTIQQIGDEEKRIAQKQLRDRFKAGEISLKEYKKKSQITEAEYDKVTLENQADALRGQIYNFTASEEERAAIMKKYNEIQGKIEDKDLESFVKREEKKLEKKKEIEAAILNLARESATAIIGLLNDQAEKEISDLEDSKDRTQEEYDLKREAVDNSFNNEAEKDAQKKVLDAEEAARTADIERQIKKQKRDQAIFEKALALAQITINTAVNASSAGNPVAAALYIAAGAVQAGIVAATPIPEYAVGKDKNNPYTGKAWAGEAGPEMWVDKDGNMKLLTSRTLINTVKGDTILNQKQMERGALKPFLQQASTHSNRDVVEALDKTNNILRTLSREPVILDQSKYYQASRNASR